MAQLHKRFRKDRYSLWAVAAMVLSAQRKGAAGGGSLKLAARLVGQRVGKLEHSDDEMMRLCVGSGDTGAAS